MTSRSEFWAVCLSPTGPFVTEPIGANDADVLVCRACRTVHPRSGRYAFEGGAEDVDQTIASGSANIVSTNGCKRRYDPSR